MKITKGGWAEMEHPEDDVPAAMHNAMEMQRRKFMPLQWTAVETWDEMASCLLRGYSISSPPKCCFCGREMGSYELVFGVTVPHWHRHAFTCGHETKYECPECAEKNNLNGPFAECSQCGCGEVYT